MTDLFGDPIYGRAVCGRILGRQQAAFDGADWIGAAEDLAELLGAELEALRVGCRAQIGGQWYVLRHDGTDWRTEAIEGADS